MTQTFDQIFEEYKLNVSALKLKPFGNHDDGYNQEAHEYAMTHKGRRDLALVKMLHEKSDAVKFASVDCIGSVYCVTYDPYGTWFDNVDGITFDIVEPIVEKPKPHLLYNNATGGKIRWHVRMMDGDIEELFHHKFDSWLKDDKYKKSMKAFSTAVGRMMKMNPHAQCHKYVAYIARFGKWMMKFERDEDVIQDIINGIMEELKTVFYKKDVEQYEKNDVLEQMIRDKSAHLTWEDCSQHCNRLFAKLDLAVAKDVDFLDIIKKKAAAVNAAKQERLSNLKRKAPEAQDEPQPKRQRPEALNIATFSETTEASKLLSDHEKLFPKDCITVAQRTRQLLTLIGELSKPLGEHAYTETVDDEMAPFRMFQHAKRQLK
jgi:hypothetical protein